MLMVLYVDCIGREGILSASTNKTYNSCRKKFVSFLNIPFDSNLSLPWTSYTDKNVSSYLPILGEANSFAVSCLICLILCHFML